MGCAGWYAFGLALLALAGCGDSPEVTAARSHAEAQLALCDGPSQVACRPELVASACAKATALDAAPSGCD